MASTESVVEEFVRGRHSRMATALAVYGAWPRIVSDVKTKFLELICSSLPEDMIRNANYGDGRDDSYVHVHRNSWRPYVINGEERFTMISLESDRTKGRNWCIGVRSPITSEVSRADNDRSQKLHEEISQLSKKLHKQHNHLWPWWEWVDAKYYDWDSLIPDLHREVKKGGGDITNYFVGKFKEIADQAGPIIDCIDGG